MAKRKSFCKVLVKFLVKFDLFGRDLDSQHNFANIKLFKTLFGALLSVLFLSTLTMYSIFKFKTMLLFNDTNINQSVQEYFYSSDPSVFNITAKKGSFQLAYGLVSYGDEIDMDYSEYGELRARLAVWNTTHPTRWEDLSTHQCSYAELGLTDDQSESQFYPVFE